MAIYFKKCFTKSNVTIHLKKRFVLLTVFLIVLVYMSLHPRTKPHAKDIDPNNFDTFRSPSVNKYKNIFFIESSCIANSSREKFNKLAEIKLSVRQACAIESAARSNPHAEVYLLHTCPVDARRLVGSRRYVREVFSYSNVFARHVDLAEFVRDTPLADWDVDEVLIDSHFPVEHGSDVMRLVALWRYGGVYLDTDVVVLKSLRDLKTNFAGFESEGLVANGVLSFDPGHELVEQCLKEILDAFDPNQFAENGPKLITKLLLKYCHATEDAELTPDNCKGFTVYRPEYFYPIEYEEYYRYFDPSEDVPNELLKLESYSYVAHVWNYISKNDLLETNKVHIYGALAGKYCPMVYKETGAYF